MIVLVVFSDKNQNDVSLLDLCSTQGLSIIDAFEHKHVQKSTQD